MNHRSIILGLSGLGCFALFRMAQAVVPAPDGGYPGGNTAEGQQALLSLTTGTYNTAVGFFSLRSNTEGMSNTAVGIGTLLVNTSAVDNTAIGAGALLSHTSGNSNTATGAFALFKDNTGQANTAVGAAALLNNTTGNINTATGFGALLGNTTGDENTATGNQALQANSTGNGNTATGSNALGDNTLGSSNTADGTFALASSATGNNSTAVGYSALSQTTGNSNTAVGFQAGSAVTTASNVICIGANVTGSDINSSCYIGSIFAQPSSGGMAVFINSDNKLGTVTSSKRFKEHIQLMDRASEALFSLKPVTFRYRSEIDPAGTPQFGLVAEEVEKVNPDLVVHDKEGRPYSVRYEQVNAMLLNEFLKGHRKGVAQDLAISQLKSALAQQQKTFESKLTQQEQQIAELMANLQRLAADIELNKAESQAVAEKWERASDL